MTYDYDLYTPTNTVGIGVWGVIAATLAIVGGLVVYFVFLNKSNEDKYKGFVWYLYEFLSFKKMWLESILKVTYLILAIYITLQSFGLIGTSFLLFILMLVLGNVILRIVYEMSLILLTICKNTTEINSKLGKTKVTKKEE